MIFGKLLRHAVLLLFCDTQYVPSQQIWSEPFKPDAHNTHLDSANGIAIDYLIGHGEQTYDQRTWCRVATAIQDL